MTVAELYRSLALGELNNLSMADLIGQTITESARPRIILYLNEALVRLYSRFILREKEVLVKMHSDITSYRLEPRFAVTYEPLNETDDEALRYLRDTVNAPFIGDVIRVLSVWDSKGEKLALNDEAACCSLFTPQYNLLQIPCPVHDDLVGVIYQAKHPTVVGELSEKITLPDVLLGALNSFIAYKVMSHLNSQDSNAKAQEYMAMYEALCAEIVEKDLVNTSFLPPNGRFKLGGWI
jgi:hypothetical protein